MVQQVLEYLKGAQPYEVGCSLLFSINPVIARNLQRAETSLNRATLEYQLRKWLKTQPAPVEQKDAPERTCNKSKPVASTPAADSPAGIRERFTQDWKQAYSERGHFHGRLHQAKTDEERYEIAKKLFECQARIDRMNEEKKQLEAGVLPDRYLRKTLTAEEYKQISNAKFYLRRYRNQLASAEGSSARAAIEKKIEKWEKKLKSYE